MHGAFTAFRAIAALALVLAMVAGLFTVRPARAGTGVMAVVSGPDAGDEPDSGGDSANGDLGNGGETDCSGGTCSDSASDAGTESVDPIESAEATGSDDPIESASPIESAEATGSDEPTESASPSASDDAAVITDGVIITGQFQEDPQRAGEFAYLYNFVSIDAVNDIRLAVAGEQTYVVAYIDDDGDPATDDVVVVDSGSTDANGMVTLDAPAGEDYFIYEEDDFNVPFGSETIPAGSASNVRVIEYVDAIAASVSASASASASESASANELASANESASTNESAAASASGDGIASSGGTASSAGTASAAASTAAGAATTLPNTGAGDSGMGSSMTWVLFALLAVVGVIAAGLGLRRRTV